jgi:hypothetical protein
MTDNEMVDRWAVYILDLIREQRADPELGRLIHRAFHGLDACENECTLKDNAEIRELVAYMKNFWLTGMSSGFIPAELYERVRERVASLDEAAIQDKAAVLGLGDTV